MNRFHEIKTLVSSLEEDFSKFYNDHNKAAGTRARKGMQELKKIAQEVRENVQKEKESLEK